MKATAEFRTLQPARQAEGKKHFRCGFTPPTGDETQDPESCWYITEVPPEWQVKILPYTLKSFPCYFWWFITNSQETPDQLRLLLDAPVSGQLMA